MTYYNKKEYNLLGYRKSKRKNKKYDAELKNIKTGKIVYVSFGDTRFENYRDLTGLNLYKTHNDPERRRLYRIRHKKHLKQGFYSPGWFSLNVLW
jgi:hypothetical protein